MKKTYNLGYEKGHYFLEYSMPKNDEGRLIIDEKRMELDSVKLYRMFFEKAIEEVDITICCRFEESVDEKIQKKGKRVCDTIQALCDEICKEINKKCFS